MPDNDIPVCGECGKPHVTPFGHQACKAHRVWARDGSRGKDRTRLPHPEPCTQPRMRGQEVCAKHGGMAHRDKGEARYEQAQAERQSAAIIAKYAADDPEVDPGEKLFDLIVWGSATVRFYREQVLKLSTDDMIWGKSKEVDGGKDAGTTYEARPNVWVGMLTAAETKLAALCVDALKVGLKQRELDLAARMADKLMPLLDAVLRELGYDPAAPEVADKVERALRAV